MDKFANLIDQLVTVAAATEDMLDIYKIASDVLLSYPDLSREAVADEIARVASRRNLSVLWWR